MKKVIMLILSICFVLCGCSEKVEEKVIEIPFQKIAACNNRTKLLEKYNYISERTASRPLGAETYSYWIMYYEKEDAGINAILDFSADYKCYYYKNQVFADYGDGNLRTVVPYREKYEDIISGLLARTDTLSYVFILNSEAKETEEGFEATYEFIVNNDILPEFEDLGIKTGDKLNVLYELDKDLIIQKCKYRKVIDEERKSEVARIDVTYNEKKVFPEEVNSANTGGEININFYENFGTGAEYSETYTVAKGTYITENEELLKYYLFKDPLYQEYFDTFSEFVEKDTDIFILDSTFADMLAAREEYMAEQEMQTEAVEEEYMNGAVNSEQ